MLLFSYLFLINYSFSLDLEEIVNTVNSFPGVTWVAKVNPKFASLSEKEFKQLSGVRSMRQTSSFQSLEANKDTPLPV